MSLKRRKLFLALIFPLSAIPTIAIPVISSSCSVNTNNQNNQEKPNNTPIETPNEEEVVKNLWKVGQYVELATPNTSNNGLDKVKGTITAADEQSITLDNGQKYTLEQISTLKLTIPDWVYSYKKGTYAKLTLSGNTTAVEGTITDIIEGDGISIKDKSGTTKSYKWKECKELSPTKHSNIDEWIKEYKNLGQYVVVTKINKYGSSIYVGGGAGYIRHIDADKITITDSQSVSPITIDIQWEGVQSIRIVDKTTKPIHIYKDTTVN